MIRRIRLCDFKTHADTVVELGRLTILVGPNGAGKTSILTALNYLSSMARLTEPWAPDEDHGPTHFIRRGAEAFRIRQEGDDWSIFLQGRLTEKNFVETDVTTHLDGSIQNVRRSGNQQVRRGVTRRASDWLYSFPEPIAHGIGRTAFLRLDARSLARPVAPTARPRIEPSGFGLAAVIAEMILGESDRLPAIIADVRRVVPQVRGLRVQTVNVPTSGEETAGRFELLVDFHSARGVPAHAVSEGTLIAIGLLTLMHAERRPRLILLDDIDQTLHPKAQWELVSALRRIIEADPTVQIVATTHSPYLVDRLTADEVRVIALDEHGISHCRALSDHPRAKALLEVLSTGELLSAEGEDWVVGRRAHD